MDIKVKWILTNGFKNSFEGSLKYYSKTNGLHVGEDFILLNEENKNDTLDFPIRAINDGYVEYLSENNATGKMIVIKTDKFFNSYQHLNKFLVNEGKHIKAGEIIGLAGNTGRITGAHLHIDKYYVNFIPEIIKLNNEEYLKAKYVKNTYYYFDPKTKNVILNNNLWLKNF